MWEMIAGLLVALAALALVLEPLALARARGSAAPDASDDLDLEDPTESDSPKVRALLALREIEFDRATGKLAEDDYVRLKAKYESDAIAAIRAEERGSRESARDLAEEVIRRARQQGRRACSTCGPRPEPTAVYCSSCGRSLVAEASQRRCAACGAALAKEAKFCAECGGAIAA